MVLQRGTLHEFHGDKHLIVFFANFVDGANVRVVQCGGRTGFPAKTFESLRVSGQFVWKKFERDKTAERGVFGLVDDAHAATAELFDYSVVRDGLADHWTMRGLRLLRS